MTELRDQLEGLITEIEGYKSLNEELSLIKDIAERRFSDAQNIIKYFETFTSEIESIVNDTLSNFSQSSQKSNVLIKRVREATIKYEDQSNNLLKLYNIASDQLRQELNETLSTSSQSTDQELVNLNRSIRNTSKDFLRQYNEDSVQLRQELKEKLASSSQSTDQKLEGLNQFIHTTNESLLKEFNPISTDVEQILEKVSKNVKSLGILKTSSANRYELHKKSLEELKSEIEDKVLELSYNLKRLSEKTDKNTGMMKVILVFCFLATCSLFYLCFIK